MFICLEFYNLQIHQVFPSSSCRRLIDVYVTAPSKFWEGNLWINGNFNSLVKRNILIARISHLQLFLIKAA